MLRGIKKQWDLYCPRNIVKLINLRNMLGYPEMPIIQIGKYFFTISSHFKFVSIIIIAIEYFEFYLQLKAVNRAVYLRNRL